MQGLDMRRRLEVEKAFRGEILRLRADYLAHSLAQVEAVRSVLEQSNLRPLPLEGLERTRIIMRRLRGTGQTYGLPDLTYWAGLVEDELRWAAKDKGRLSPRQRSLMRSLVKEMIALLKTERQKTESSSSPPPGDRRHAFKKAPSLRNHQ